MEQNDILKRKCDLYEAYHKNNLFKLLGTS